MRKNHKGLKVVKKGMDVNIIAYADKATESFDEKHQKFSIERNVPRNSAIVAEARESCMFYLGNGN